LPTSLTEIVGAFRMSESTAPSGSTPPVRAKRGPGRPRALPVEEQRRKVLDAARSVFAQNGFHGATIEAVARLSGTPRPTVYELFGTKDDLFVVVVDDAAERVVRRLSASFGESEEFSLEAFVRHNFAAVFDLFEHDRDAVMVLLNAEQGVIDRPTPAPAEMRRQVLQEVAEFTRSRWGLQGLDVGASAEIMALIFFRMAESLAVREISEPGWDREAFIDLLTQFTIGGINHLWQDHQDVLIAAGRRTLPDDADDAGDPDDSSDTGDPDDSSDPDGPAPPPAVDPP
jgi:AcrR family transcriptional regulator